MSTHQAGDDSHAQTLAQLRGLLASAEESARSGSAAGATGSDDFDRSVSPDDARGMDPCGESQREPSAGARPSGVSATVDGRGGSDSLQAAGSISDEATAYDIALRRLSVRARSEAELRRDLRQRRVEASTIDTVLSRLEHAGLVDDVEFARQWVEERQRRQGLSTARLSRELAGKGVTPDTIRQVVAQACQPQSEIALEFARKRVRSMSGLDRTTMMRRLSGQLARRGFPESVVRTVVMTVADERETS
ncbi:MAG: recombination regulator RecX [Propionibacteriaceae bacterium]|jgi:regulatory protein|nr:recombination regulator RecX [Propionibacteriaceae bacterium]